MVLTQRASLHADVLVMSALHLGYYRLLRSFMTLVFVPFHSRQLESTPHHDLLYILDRPALPRLATCHFSLLDKSPACPGQGQLLGHST